MATTLSKIQSQIEKLQKQADQLKADVIQRLRKEIDQHGLTAADLFGGTAPSTIGRGTRGRSVAKTPAAPRAAKYGDGAGNTWGGMGKRPQWLRDALEGGASIDDFLLAADAGKHSRVGQMKASASAPAKKSRASKAVAKKGQAGKRLSSKSSSGKVQASKRKPSRGANSSAAKAREESAGAGSGSAPT